LAVLSQDLSSFNLEAYRRIEGRHTLAELGAWVRAMILHLGGAAIPEGQFWTLHVPEALQRKHHLAPRYARMCFDRDLALRVRNSELGGIGHPLVDALLHEAKDPAFQGSVARMGSGNEIYARFLVHYEDEAGKTRSKVLTFRKAVERLPELIASVEWLGSEESVQAAGVRIDDAALKQSFNEALAQHLVDWQPDRTKRARVHTELVGLHAG
jgi:hypothetical protein